MVLTLIIETFDTQSETSGIRTVKYTRSSLKEVIRNAHGQKLTIETNSPFLVDGMRIENVSEEVLWSNRE